jgi:Tfp pilus assembly protein PilN
MQAVNLLPAYARPGHRWADTGKDLPAKRVLTAGSAVAAAAALALGGIYFHERSVVNDKRATLADVQARLTAAEAAAQPLRTAQADAAARLAAFQTISAKRLPWEIFLRDLSRVLPDNVYLQSLQATSPTPAASVAPTTSSPSTAGATTSFTVTGLASSQVRVALVLDRLALLPWLSNVTLQSSARGSAAGAGAGDQFSLSAQLQSVGGAR